MARTSSKHKKGKSPVRLVTTRGVKRMAHQCNIAGVPPSFVTSVKRDVSTRTALIFYMAGNFAAANGARNINRRHVELAIDQVNKVLPAITMYTSRS